MPKNIDNTLKRLINIKYHYYYFKYIETIKFLLTFFYYSRSILTKKVYSEYQIKASKTTVKLLISDKKTNTTRVLCKRNKP